MDRLPVILAKVLEVIWMLGANISFLKQDMEMKLLERSRQVKTEVVISSNS